MREYLRKLLLLLLPLALLLGMMEGLLRRVPNDYSWKRDLLDRSGGDLELLVLGSSPSYNGVHPDLILPHGVNAANISQGYIHDEAILEHYLPHLPKLKWIVLEAGYASFRSDPRQGKESWRAKNYVLYYGFWRFGSRPEHFLELLNRPMDQQVTMIEEHLRYGKDNRVCAEDGTGLMFPQKGLDLERDGTEAAKRHTLTPSDNYARNFERLEHMIVLAAQAGVQVYLYTPPSWPSYQRGMDQAQRVEALAACNALAAQHPNVHYHDHLSDLPLRAADFFNANHLSASGAGKLSRTIAAEMRSDTQGEAKDGRP